MAPTPLLHVPTMLLMDIVASALMAAAHRRGALLLSVPLVLRGVLLLGRGLYAAKESGRNRVVSRRLHRA